MDTTYVDCRPSCPTLWFAESDNTQLMMASSGCMTARSWTFSFPKTSRYGRALLQNAKGLFCDSSIGACQKLQTAFLLPVTPQVLSGLLDHTSGPSGKTAWTAAWTYY